MILFAAKGWASDPAWSSEVYWGCIFLMGGQHLQASWLILQDFRLVPVPATHWLCAEPHGSSASILLLLGLFQGPVDASKMLAVFVSLHFWLLSDFVQTASGSIKEQMISLKTPSTEKKRALLLIPPTYNKININEALTVYHALLCFTYALLM